MGRKRDPYSPAAPLKMVTLYAFIILFFHFMFSLTIFKGW